MTAAHPEGPNPFPPGARMPLLATLALLAGALNIAAAADRPQGIFELRLKKFQNFHASDIDGNCCQPQDRTTSICSGRCDTKFRVCLKHFQKDVVTTGCTFGEEITPVLGANNLTINRPTIKFDINFKWPGTFSLIIEAYHQDQRGRLVGSNSTLLHRIIKSESLESGPAWVYGGDNKLEYDFRLICANEYYGTDCDILCKPRNDNFGHYTCGPGGEKLCLAGWERRDATARDDYCMKPQCAAGCSEEYGSCHQPNECKCRIGWTGADCTQCEIYPGCEHGTCNAPYTCECDSGWGGHLCNIDLNFCTKHRPCHNGATCFNTGKDYTCSCPIGFTGRNCETRVENKCQERPCQNGGNCKAGAEDDYTCSCASGFHGPHCEFTSDFDICTTDNPCQNSATCRSDTTGYTCMCPDGFEGRNCETVIDHCVSNPCENNGICFKFINDYKCVCQNGFIGRNCQENYNDCQNAPCANGGTCSDGVNDFTCTCLPGFTGKDCSQEVNECDPNPCLNGGFCKDGNNTFSCICLPRYSGGVCEILPDGTIDPEYYAIRANPTNPSDASGNVVLIGTFSAVVPLGALLAAVLIYCMKQRRKHEQRAADFEAQMENELNAVNCVNKNKNLDDHMIVNSFPKTKNTNPNLVDEDVFAAKDSAYAQMSRTKSTKQLNTDVAQNRASYYCDKLDNSRVHPDKLRLVGKPSKPSNLDISSSTLNSSYSDKCSLKKETNREAAYPGSCGSSSPAPSDPYDQCGAGKCLADDLLATEV